MKRSFKGLFFVAFLIPLASISQYTDVINSNRPGSDTRATAKERADQRRAERAKERNRSASGSANSTTKSGTGATGSSNTTGTTGAKVGAGAGVGVGVGGAGVDAKIGAGAGANAGRWHWNQPLQPLRGATAALLAPEIVGAIVTGGGSGLGEAIGKRLAARGASVVLTDINRKAAERVNV